MTRPKYSFNKVLNLRSFTRFIDTYYAHLKYTDVEYDELTHDVHMTFNHTLTQTEMDQLMNLINTHDHTEAMSNDTISLEATISNLSQVIETNRQQLDNKIMGLSNYAYTSGLSTFVLSSNAFLTNEQLINKKIHFTSEGSNVYTSLLSFQRQANHPMNGIKYISSSTGNGTYGMRLYNVNTGQTLIESTHSNTVPTTFTMTISNDINTTVNEVIELHCKTSQPKQRVSIDQPFVHYKLL